jgi:hypothetical protein
VNSDLVNEEKSDKRTKWKSTRKNDHADGKRSLFLVFMEVDLPAIWSGLHI